jgi:hypothetical protein
MQKNETKPLSSITEISRLDYETTRKNINEMLQDIGMSKSFWDKTTKAQNKNKIDK